MTVQEILKEELSRIIIKDTKDGLSTDSIKITSDLATHIIKNVANKYAEQEREKAFIAGWTRRQQEAQASTFNGYEITAPDLKEYKQLNPLN